MKVTVVPAQVTTVEDRIAGDLGMSQLVLLAAPIFLGGGLYIIFPPTMHSATYKIIAIVLLFLICSALAIRIKGKIVLLWLIVLLRYNMRPRYYLFDKRSLHGRKAELDNSLAVLEDEPVVITHKVREALSFSPAELLSLQDLIDNPTAHLSFETNKKGKLYARITEISPES